MSVRRVIFVGHGNWYGCQTDTRHGAVRRGLRARCGCEMCIRWRADETKIKAILKRAGLSGRSISELLGLSAFLPLHSRMGL